MQEEEQEGVNPTALWLEHSTLSALPQQALKGKKNKSGRIHMEEAKLQWVWGSMWVVELSQLLFTESLWVRTEQGRVQGRSGWSTAMAWEQWGCPHTRSSSRAQSLSYLPF